MDKIRFEFDLTKTDIEEFVKDATYDVMGKDEIQSISDFVFNIMNKETDDTSLLTNEELIKGTKRVIVYDFLKGMQDEASKKDA